MRMHHEFHQLTISLPVRFRFSLRRFLKKPRDTRPGHEVARGQFRRLWQVFARTIRSTPGAISRSPDDSPWATKGTGPFGGSE